MAQFMVCANRHPASCRQFPYFIDIQSNLLRDLPTTVVIPVCDPASVAGKVLTRLCPLLEIKAQSWLVMTPQLAGIERKQLGEVVQDVSAYRDVLLAAVDFITSGI